MNIEQGILSTKIFVELEIVNKDNLHSAQLHLQEDVHPRILQHTSKLFPHIF